MKAKTRLWYENLPSGVRLHMDHPFSGKDLVFTVMRGTQAVATIAGPEFVPQWRVPRRGLEEAVGRAAETCRVYDVVAT